MSNREGHVVKILKLEDNYVEFELVGEDYTIANLIAKYAINHPNIKYSAYSIEHPLISNPKIIIRTKEKKAIEAIYEVLNTILQDIEKLTKLINDELAKAKK
ncbi:MAG: DNA-directed RNA polymerase subunit L [Pyrodictiaceae archaeon]